MSWTPTHTIRAGSAARCSRCGAALPAGTEIRRYRERALSYAEARATGTMYPTRRECRACGERRLAAQEAP